MTPATDHHASDPASWVANHGDALFAYAMKRVRERTVAEDLVQETFMAALDARDSFEGRSPERTWLVGILKNKIVDYFRKVGRELSFERTGALGHDDPDFDSSTGAWQPERRPQEWQVNVADEVERREFWEFLTRCLNQLDQRHAVVFVLREMEELSSDNICNAMGLQPTNLRVMLHRSRKDLRRCLETLWLGRMGK